MEINNFQSKYVEKIIKKALKKIGIEKGDIILVHSNVTPALKLSNSNSWENALSLLKKCFLNVLGPTGTLIVPTFNYDFCKGKPYSHEKSMSQIGMFTNYILLDNTSYRSFHPIFSFAAIGPDAKNICDNISKSSFGKESVFHKLHKLNAKIVFFNVSFEFCTFIHYVEQSIGVDYRFLKYFKGKVKMNNIEWEDSFDFYVRYLDREVITSLTRLGNYLESTGKMNKIILANKYPISLTRVDDIYQAASKKLKKYPYYLLKHPPDKLEI
jgi:aminoglycoside 3-N-acetyltransferase